MKDRHEIDGQTSAAQAIIAQSDAMHSELYDAALALRDECHELIRIGDAKRYRKPPCTLSVRTRAGEFGPRLLWIRFDSKKNNVPGRGEIRFTREIGGRRGGRYPKTIFRGFSEELSAELIRIEARAAAIRDRVSFWSAVLAISRKIVHEAED